MRAAIHPAIGIARVGNSEKGFFIGPEVTDPLPVKPGFAKRFRRSPQARSGPVSRLRFQRRGRGRRGADGR